MRRRVFIVSAEYSASPRDLPQERRRRDFFAGPRPDPKGSEIARQFFRYPNRGEEGRTHPEDWQRTFGISEPVGLLDLFASAAHRAITTLHSLTGGDYRRTCESITDMLVTSMPGLDPIERVNIGLVPQALQVLLGLPPRVRAQFVVGTSDSGAQAFSEAVRAARTAEGPQTTLVLAGQIIPSGYVSQYQIRTVLGEDDQAHGLDMLAIGDVLMDVMRRNFNLPASELEAFLTRVSARKAQTGANYPAGIQAGKPYKRDTPRTPWFDAADIAVPCCGAAATIVTSDEKLIEAIAASRSPRYRSAPLTEVLGVGDGSSNPDVLHRKSPLIFPQAVYSALANTADDAKIPLSTLPACAFGVLHDAFPSIELSFLLALGLGWDRAAERMAEGWSNPVGGLLTFGHALGASGLVQVNKAHHLFSLDQRYLPEAQSRQGFRADGALAFTTSVGGPLSHIVCTFLRGGHDEGRPLHQRPLRGPPQVPVSASWEAKSRLLRLLVPSQLQAVPGAWLLEGVTSVSIRSCLKALPVPDILRLKFEGLEELISQDAIDEVRQRLRTVVRVAQQESDRLGSMFDVFRLLTDEVREIASECRSRGKVQPSAAALDEKALAGRMKECLRVTVALLGRPNTNGAHRDVRFLPNGAAGLEQAEFVAAETLRPLQSSPETLPFWNLRAVRRSAPAAGTTGEEQRIEELAQRGPATAAELELLRAWFTLEPARPVLESALRASGAVAAQSPRVRAVFYAGEIVDSGPRLSPEEAHELLGFMAHRARAYLEAYESEMTQVGPTLSVVAFERPPFRSRVDAALLSAARFAQEVGRSLLDQGVVMRASVCADEGAVFYDVNGRCAVASPGSQKATQLLASVRDAAPHRPGFALEGASQLIAMLLEQRLTGWQRLGDTPADVALWTGPLR
jgi:hypothetical protein